MKISCILCFFSCFLVISSFSVEPIYLLQRNNLDDARRRMRDIIDLIEHIIREGAVSDANLRLLVDRIEIGEQNDKLDIKTILNANFLKHKDYYDEKGTLTERIFLENNNPQMM